MIVDCLQGDSVWLQTRAGRVTGSRMDAVMAYSKKKVKEGEAPTELAARSDYRSEIICEIMSGRSIDHYVSPAMLWGTEQEPFARAEYEIKTDNLVDEIGFAIHERIPRFGASPDGIIGADGVIEIKCPTLKTHKEYLMEGIVPEDYKPQMMAEMACTGRQWCDFISFHPWMPPRYQLFVRRFHRDEAQISAMESEVEKFLAEVDAEIERLKQCEPIRKEATVESV